MSAEAEISRLLREQWFWAGVLRDHARFILDSLPPDEVRLAQVAAGLRDTLTALHEEVRRLATGVGLDGPAGSYALYGPPAAPPMVCRGRALAELERAALDVNRQLLDLTRAAWEFKQELLQNRLDCRVRLGLGPTLLAHMVVEAEEAYRVLARGGEPAPPALAALHHHLIWLPDASEHAAVLQNGMDGVERSLRVTAAGFREIFDGMHLRALELYSMLRVAPRMVGALRRLNRDAVQRIAAFRGFLAQLREHLEGCEVLGTLMPLFADHMLREELYYTEQVLAVDPEAARPAAGRPG